MVLIFICISYYIIIYYIDPSETRREKKRGTRWIFVNIVYSSDEKLAQIRVH